jgi:hypothetical protein
MRWLFKFIIQTQPWLDQGLPGAFGLKPLFLFDEVQWDWYVSMMRKLPLYRFFGSWTQSGPVDSAGRRLRALAQASKKRKHERTAARRRLLKAAQRLWPGLQAQVRTSRRGRPALRAALGTALQTIGCKPSRRDLTWVVKSLVGRRNSVDTAEDGITISDQVDEC